MKFITYLLLSASFILTTHSTLSQSFKLDHDQTCGGVYHSMDELSETNQLLSRGTTPFLSATFSQKTVQKNSGETIKFLVEVDDPNITSIRLQPNMLSDWWLTQDGAYRDEILLYDDGTNGDEVAGDMIFTIDKIGYQFQFQVDENNFWAIEEKPYGRFILREVNLITSTGDGAEESHEVDLGTTLKYVDTTFIATPAVKNLAPDIYATDYVVNIVIDPVGEFPSLFPDYSAAVQRYYDLFPDDLDYIAVESEYTNTNASSAGSYTRLRNETQGTGIDIFDEASAFGSEERLKGLLSLHYDNTSPFTLTHEILHEHGVSSRFQEAFDLGGNAGHWGMFEDNSSGFIGTSVQSGVLLEIEDLGDGMYQSPRSWNENSISNELLNEWYENEGSPEDYFKYNNLELYLMGLLPKEDVDTITTLANWERLGIWTDTDLNISYDQFRADGVRSIHINEIVETLGARVPDYQNSQKSFRMGLVVTSDRPLTPLELSYFDFAMRDYERETPAIQIDQEPNFTFFQSTKGLATMSTKLQPTSVNINPLVEGTNGVKLEQNFPNPLKDTSVIQFELSETINISLDIFDAAGRHIRNLVNGQHQQGIHQSQLDGSALSNGMYYYRLETSKGILTRKFSVVK